MKLERLTNEQEQKMLQVRDFWLNYIFSCKTAINKDAAKIGIDWLYNSIGKKSPVVIYVDSPMGCQYAVAYLKEIIKVIGVNSSTDQVRAQVRAQVVAQVWAQVVAQVGDQVRAQVWDQVRDQVRAQVVDQVGAQVVAQVGDQVGVEYTSFTGYAGGSIYDYGWVSFYDFFTQVGVIDHAGFNQFKSVLLSGIYDMIQLEGFCIVSSLPSKIIRNAEGRLHNPNGPAIEFADGYAQHYVNGRALPSWIWEKAAAGQITKEMFLREPNSEIKGGIYEVLGQKRMMDLLGAIEIDSCTITHRNGDLETVTLLKTSELFEEIDGQPFAWVKMVCPSTGTQYLQGVDPHHTDALTAIASLSPFKPEDYSFDLRS
ncbi:DUF6745 domain-containing protein [Chitinophaga sp. sic0106]|uniref:DUF6745 domain-containing protein n=1 Tax=Chitinophaga sp. sic0106 TaxID=2854785 RepID=UPI001C478658|nr:hypothetical protein [Chitinophaga sp. sic0106]MBV7534079.1 hypothetical protein [Chitinophaga sp. sic0106]